MYRAETRVTVPGPSARMAISESMQFLCSWPVATMELEGKTVRVFAAKYTDGKTEKVPGAVVSTDKGGLEIACADGETLLITELQAPGKKRMGAEDYLRGHQIKVE